MDDRRLRDVGPPTVYLHIGAPKSGTTYLQSRFARNRERARAQGLWIGPSRERQIAAANELRRLAPGEKPSRSGAWTPLAEEALARPEEAVLVSVESLVELLPHQVEAALASLEPARVEVVVTARDLLRSFVAQGQEMAKHYRTWPWSQLVAEVLRDTGGPAHQRFWRQQDLPEILGRWRDMLPGDQVHLVTLPPAGADPQVLWRRFCGVLGIDGGGFRRARSDNASLGAVSTTLMQRLNTVAEAQGVGHRDYMRALHRGVALDVLAARRRREEPIGLGPDIDAYLRERSARMVEDLRRLDMRLHGDWADLVPGAPVEGRRPETVTEGELLEVALEALVTLAVSRAENDPGRRLPTGDLRSLGRDIARRGRRAARTARRLVPGAGPDRRG